MPDRHEFELTEEQLARVKEAARPVPYLVVGGIPPESATSRVNRVWQALGKEIGFDWRSVLPVPAKNERFFEATPTTTEESEAVPYHGYIEVDVRLMRQGHGAEGEEYAQVQRRSARFEEADMLKHTAGAAGLREVTDRVRDMIRDVLDEDSRVELLVRWDKATKDMSMTQMRRALEVLES